MKSEAQPSLGLGFKLPIPFHVTIALMLNMAHVNIKQRFMKKSFNVFWILILFFNFVSSGIG